VAYNESLAQRVGDALARKRNISEKRMFGGVGFLLNGNMLVAVRKDSLLVRLGETQANDAMSEPFVSRFVSAGRTIQGWILVAPEGVEEDDRIADWIRKALRFVRTLPAK